VDVHVTLGGRGELAGQIYRQLLDAILDGRLRPGERLPATRDFARGLDVSRNTVALAYERLGAEGYVTGRVGAGTYVCAEPPGPVRRQPRPRRAPGAEGLSPRPIWRTLPLSATAASTPPAYDFGVGIPDARLFPFQAWRRIIARELRPSTFGSGDYSEPQGHPGLRAAIARHIGVSRSVRAGADDVLVTHGAQQALDLIGRVLVEPGTVVAVEEPGYPPVRHLFASLGARVVGVPVDAEGLTVSALPDSARLIYVTPSHQFPLGTAMSLARRTALLSWAQARGAVVVEDDYDSEFRYSERPLEPLQSIDRAGRVVYIGSLSKTLLPALRMGFLVAPPSLLGALRTAKQLSDWHCDSLTQAALARFIDEGLLARHIRRATRHYAPRHEQVIAALRHDLAAWLVPVPSVAGLHICARLVPGSDVDVARVVEEAGRHGVAIRSLASYCVDGPPQPGLVIGFGAIPTERVADGLRLLAEVLPG
jgi:GntR family transcriptional regulator / MocR family aminotransferase